MTTLEKAIAWRDRLVNYIGHSSDPQHVKEHIEILDYLIEKAQEQEDASYRAEVSE